MSSPELTSSSNGSSPESSAGANTAPASVPVESKSAQAKQPKPAAMAAADKRKQEDNTKSSANKDRRASTGESGAIAHTHDQIGSEDEGKSQLTNLCGARSGPPLVYGLTTGAWY